MGFIAAVVHDPQILILDEAFSGLDPVNVELLKSTVKELRDKGTSILFSTHRMEHVEELCKNITILHRSNTVVKGNLKDIKSKYPREEVVLGTSGEVRGLEALAGVTAVERTEDGYPSGSARLMHQNILNTAMSQSTIHRFEVKEPTLNQIFIKAVGESNE